jgi:hypothetical protein
MVDGTSIRGQDLFRTTQTSSGPWYAPAKLVGVTAEPGIDLDDTVGRSSKLESLIVKCNSVVRVLPAVLKQCLNLSLKLVLVHHARV